MQHPTRSVAPTWLPSDSTYPAAENVSTWDNEFQDHLKAGRVMGHEADDWTCALGATVATEDPQVRAERLTEFFNELDAANTRQNGPQFSSVEVLDLVDFVVGYFLGDHGGRLEADCESGYQHCSSVSLIDRDKAEVGRRADRRLREGLDAIMIARADQMSARGDVYWRH